MKPFLPFCLATFMILLSYRSIEMLQLGLHLLLKRGTFEYLHLYNGRLNIRCSLNRAREARCTERSEVSKRFFNLSLSKGKRVMYTATFCLREPFITLKATSKLNWIWCANISAGHNTILQMDKNISPSTCLDAMHYLYGHALSLWLWGLSVSEKDLTFWGK